MQNSEFMRRLHEYISQNFRITANEGRALSVGLEQEFFLLTRDQNPCLSHQSQRFFAELAASADWYVREKSTFNSQELIERISLEGRSGYTTLSYDHHPHLLEFSFSKSQNLHELFELVSDCFSIANKIAEKLDLCISVFPVLNNVKNHESLISPLTKFEALRKCRENYMASKGISSNKLAVNYAAYIAATQTHVGCIDFGEIENLVNWLYYYEPAISRLNSLLSLEDVEKSKVVQMQRWDKYYSAFQGIPLLGVPSFEKWTLSGWIEALLNSPLCGFENESWSGKTVAELGYNPTNEWSLFIKAARDLQVVKPRMFGTLELRGDGAMGSPQKILAAAALRLGVSEYLRRAGQAPSLKEANSDWNKIRLGKPINPKEVVSLAEKGLNFRGLHEERFLSPYYQIKQIESLIA